MLCLCFSTYPHARSRRREKPSPIVPWGVEPPWWIHHIGVSWSWPHALLVATLKWVLEIAGRKASRLCFFSFPFWPNQRAERWVQWILLYSTTKVTLKGHSVCIELRPCASASGCERAKQRAIGPSKRFKAPWGRGGCCSRNRQELRQSERAIDTLA